MLKALPGEEEIFRSSSHLFCAVELGAGFEFYDFPNRLVPLQFGSFGDVTVIWH